MFICILKEEINMNNETVTIVVIALSLLIFFIGYIIGRLGL